MFLFILFLMETVVFLCKNVLYGIEDCYSRNVLYKGYDSLFDADVALSMASLLKVTVSTPHGAFAFSASVSGIQMVRNDSNTTVFRCFLSQVNTALMGSAYIPTKDWYGSEQIMITVANVTRVSTSVGGRAFCNHARL